MKDIKHSLNYRADIDGLRGLAVLSVFFYHLYPAVLRGGFVGVDIFFIISGYLISKIILLQIQENKFSFSEFYARRIKRIFPALFTVLLFAGLLAVLILTPEEYERFFKAAKNTSLQISNFYFAHKKIDYFGNTDDSSPLLHTWSLGVEEQFYLIWPLLIFLFIHKFKGKIKNTLYIFTSIFVLSLFTSEYLVRHIPLDAFFLLHSRAWELALGGLLAYYSIYNFNALKNTKALNLVSLGGLLLILFSVIFYSKTMNFPGLLALVPCIGTVLVIYAGCQNKKLFINKFLSNKLLVFIGVISYSLYLWHWVIICFHKIISDTKEINILVGCIIFILSLIISYLSYKYIETPFRKIKANNKKVIFTGISLMLIFLLLSFAFVYQEDAKWRLGNNTQKVLKHPYTSIKKHMNAVHSELILTNKQASKNSKEVLVLGDSHSEHYIPLVSLWARDNNYKIKHITLAGAPALIGDYYLSNKNNNKFTQYQNNINKYLKNHSPEYIFLAMRQDSFTEDTFISVQGHKAGARLFDNKNSELSTNNSRRVFTEQLTHTVNILTQDNNIKKIIILGQVPLLATDYPIYCYMKQDTILGKYIYKYFYKKDFTKCYAQHTESASRLATGYNIYNNINNNKVIIFDPRKYMQKPFDNKKQFMYLDDDHINIYGAQHLYKYINF